MAFIWKGQKREMIANVKDSEGNLKTGRQDIADVFAAFYEDLFDEGAVEEVDDSTIPDNTGEAPAVTRQEVEAVLKSMSKRKAADVDGVVVECFQQGGAALAEALAELFTDILHPSAQPPSYWKSTKLKVIMKKGDPQLPENYRPIAVLPILYKIFSKVTCNRVREVLDKAQSCDQAGFRSG